MTNSNAFFQTRALKKFKIAKFLGFGSKKSIFDPKNGQKSIFSHLKNFHEFFRIACLKVEEKLLFVLLRVTRGSTAKVGNERPKSRNLGCSLIWEFLLGQLCTYLAVYPQVTLNSMSCNFSSTFKRAH